MSRETPMDADESAFYKRVGARIKRRRIARGLSLVELARLSGLRHQVISRYERGTQRATLYKLIKIAGAMEMRQVELLDEFARGR